MGLFEFVKEAGESILKGEEKEPEGIKELIMSKLGDSVKDLAVDMISDKVKLSGDAKSPDILEKAILLAGNLKGVKSVDSDGLLLNSEKPSSDLGSQFYTIVKGDSLWKIAKKFYGDGNKYPEIFEANREVIKDPDLIYPGQTIRIPPK
jgi:nucleoid-associated protein YgaU